MKKNLFILLVLAVSSLFGADVNENFENTTKKTFGKYPEDSDFTLSVSKDIVLNSHSLLVEGNGQSNYNIYNHYYKFLPSSKYRLKFKYVNYQEDLEQINLTFDFRESIEDSDAKRKVNQKLIQIEPEIEKPHEIVVEFDTPDFSTIPIMTLGFQFLCRNLRFSIDDLEITLISDPSSDKLTDLSAINRANSNYYMSSIDSNSQDNTKQIWPISDDELSEFFLNTSKSKGELKTKGSLVINNNFIYVTIVSQINEKTSRGEPKKESIWNNESIEIFLVSSIGDVFHFVIDEFNQKFTRKLTPSSYAETSGFSEDLSWTSNIQSTIKRNQGHISYKILIPLSEIKLFSENNDLCYFNLNRNDSINREHHTYSRLLGAFLNPKSFSKIQKISDDTFLISRNTQRSSERVISVKRDKKLFKSLQGTDPFNPMVSSWTAFGGLQIFNKLDDKLKSELQSKTISEMTAANIAISFDSTLRLNFKVNNSNDAVKSASNINLKTILYPFLYNEGVDERAIQRGADALSKIEGEPVRFKPSVIDPVFTDAAISITKESLSLYGNEAWVAPIVYGHDEPTNGEEEKISLIKNPNSKFVKNFDLYIKEKYGYGLPSRDALTEHEAKLSNISFSRGWNEYYIDQKKKINSIFKEKKSNLKFLPVTFNLIEGLRFDDFSMYDQSTGDVISGDPYASWVTTPGRGLYSHSFGIKILKDITKVKEVHAIVQAFSYNGYTPNISDIKEWTSQALKVGADHIQFFDYEDNFRITNENLYFDILSMVKRIRSMNKLKVPKSANVAILHSYYSQASEGITSDANELYTAHSILGEKMNVWFQFVSDRDIERNQKTLDNYKVLIIPYAPFTTEEIYSRIITFIKKGGIVYFFDPLSLEYDLKGGNFKSLKKNDFGVQINDLVKSKELIFMNELGYFPSYRRVLPKGIGTKQNSYSLQMTNNSHHVLASYKEGSPALIKGKLGSGVFYYFGSNPLNSNLLVDNSSWLEKISVLLKESGYMSQSDIWNFHVDGE